MVPWLARCHGSRAATRSPIAEVLMIQNEGVVPQTVRGTGNAAPAGDPRCSGNW